MGFKFDDKKYMYRARFQLPKGASMIVTVGANDLKEANQKVWKELPQRFKDNPRQAKKSCLVTLERVCENIRYVEKKGER